MLLFGMILSNCFVNLCLLFSMEYYFSIDLIKDISEYDCLVHVAMVCDIIDLLICLFLYPIYI
jgi:hypothetical protein